MRLAADRAPVGIGGLLGVLLVVGGLFARIDQLDPRDIEQGVVAVSRHAPDTTSM